MKKSDSLKIQDDYTAFKIFSLLLINNHRFPTF